jgi:hypothetical protein
MPVVFALSRSGGGGVRPDHASAFLGSTTGEEFTVDQQNASTPAGRDPDRPSGAAPAVPPTRRLQAAARSRRGLAAALSVALVAATAVAISMTANSADAAVSFEIQSLDGSDNNLANPNWGKVGTNYTRVGPARYADGIGAPVGGPNSRLQSNRVFNDSHQNLFSERGVTQWGFAWGQFLDHTFGLRQAPGVGDSPDPSSRNIEFDPGDPIEEFENSLGEIPFTRSSIAPGTGTTNPREQVNTVSSYIDAWAVYGGTSERLEFMREGPLDGNLANNSAKLLLPGGLLPRRDSRGNAATAPAMDTAGRIATQPARAMVAGDVRANENILLTATHTLFAREHNRIVDLLADEPGLSEEDKFQIARRIVIAEQQHITYAEFLPALGVNLPAYTGYKPNVNANLGNEFATVGYRAHSQIHGEAEFATDLDRYSQAQLDAMEAMGVEVIIEGDEVELVVPLNVAFFNPDLVGLAELGPILQGLGGEPQYKNDEQIDNQLRSVLFEIPVADNPECLDGPELPACFEGVVDLGAIDVERGRDHGMPSYNQLRQAFGLPAKTTFRSITGESSDAFPSDPQLTPGNEVNDPDSLDVVRLFHLDGTEIPLDSELAESSPIRMERRTPLAARLRAVFGNVNNVDAFTGMVSEPHVAGTEFGELQLAMWRSQYQALRDGDRFFYLNNPGLSTIKSQYGIDYQRNLGDIIALNTDIARADLNTNVFFDGGNQPPTSCRVTYRVTTTWPGNFQVDARITNTGTVPLNGWTLRFAFPNGQEIYDLWNGVEAVEEGHWEVVNLPEHASIPPGGSRQFGFNATRPQGTNNRPAVFNLNTTNCTVG